MPNCGSGCLPKHSAAALVARINITLPALPVRTNPDHRGGSGSTATADLNSKFAAIAAALVKNRINSGLGPDGPRYPFPLPGNEIGAGART